MIKLVFILVALLLVSCSTFNKQQVVHELAKKAVNKKLQLPEGVKFNNENIEVIEVKTGDGILGASYLTKISIKSQDLNVSEVLKTAVINFRKIDEDGLVPEDYKLISFI